MDAEYTTFSASGTGIQATTHEILVFDKDTRIVLQNPTKPLKEGESGSFEVLLSGNPGISRTVSLVSDNPLLEIGTTTPTSFTFDENNWNVFQTVSMKSINDTNFVMDVANITGTATALVSGTLEVGIQDKDNMLDGSVAHYPFNGNSLDESGNGNHGTPYGGASLTTNRYGYKDRAYYFNGVDGSIDFGNPTDTQFDLNSDATILMWIKLDSLPPDPPSHPSAWTLVGKDVSAGENPKWIFNLEHNRLHYHINAPFIKDGGVTAYSDTFALEVGKNYQVGFRKTGNIIRFYLNGIQIGSEITMPVDTPISGASFKAGYSETPFPFFTGQIDDIYFFKKSLIDAEVLAIYNDTKEIRKSCKQILIDGLSVGDGKYMIDPDGVGGEDPFWAYCDMTTEGGGWTLVMTSSDDGQNTWTMNNRTLMTTDRTLIGNVDEPNKDFKSLALHTLEFQDLLFVHAPSNVTAVYGAVGDHTESFGDFLSNKPIFATGSDIIAYPKTSGTLTLSGKLRDTNLYFNLKDHDGEITETSDSTFGPVWNGSNNHNLDYDDPGMFAFGPIGSIPSMYTDDELDVQGFGYALGLNNGTTGAAENYIQMYVR